MRIKTKTLNHNTYATHPGLVRMSLKKVSRFHPELCCRFTIRWFLFRRLRQGIKFWRLRIKEQLMYGDSRAALVVSVEPLLIAAYSSEIDGVAMLWFPQDLVRKYRLKPGSRLLTVNTYTFGNVPVADLEYGPNSRRVYCNFMPMIAEFLSSDMKRIEQRKREISEDEWERADAFARVYRIKYGNRCRNGAPMEAGTPLQQP